MRAVWDEEKEIRKRKIKSEFLDIYIKIINERFGKKKKKVGAFSLFVLIYYFTLVD